MHVYVCVRMYGCSMHVHLHMCVCTCLCILVQCTYVCVYERVCACVRSLDTVLSLSAFSSRKQWLSIPQMWFLFIPWVIGERYK